MSPDADRSVAGLGDRLADPQQTELAERRLIRTLRRIHRHDPLAADVRVDALLARLREGRSESRGASHRGGARLELDDAALRAVIEAMVADGRLVRRGHRVRLPDHVPQLGHVMRGRADALLSELRAAGASPPRAEAVARRLGIPDAVLAFLRSSGELVSLSSDIDYPSDVFSGLVARIRDLDTPRTVARVRDEIGGSRRYAAALLAAVEEGSERP